MYGIMADERMFRFTKSYMEHEIIRGIKASGVKRYTLPVEVVPAGFLPYAFGYTVCNQHKM